MSEPAMNYEDGPPPLQEVAPLAVDPVEAARADRSRQRVGYLTLAASRIDQFPEGLDAEQLQAADDHLAAIHDLPKTLTESSPLLRSQQMRLFREGWTFEEIAAEMGSTVASVKQNRSKYLDSLNMLIPKGEIALALQDYAADPEQSFAEILPAPEIKPRTRGPGKSKRRLEEDDFSDLADPSLEDTPDEAEPVTESGEITEEDEDDSWSKEAPTTDLVRLYLTDIGRVALLNAEQEVDLSKRIEAGLYAAEKLRQNEAGELHLSKQMIRNLNIVAIDGARSRNHLLEANLRLVVSLAKRYQGKGMTLLDLIQEGNIGLTRAVEKFDYMKGYKFSTYATWWIRQALQRGIADQGRTIRIPVHMVENINKALRVKRDLTNESGQAPSFAEIGAVMDLTPERVEEILSYGRETISLETPVGDDGTATFGEFIEDMDAPIASDVVDFGLLQDRLGSVLRQLPERSAGVIRARFGLDDGKAKTLDEVGRMYNLTRERIRQIERDTLRELRRNDTAATLKAWL